MSLREYQRKRDFAKTREPSGSRTGKRKGAPRFVIQKHEAARLHYDFRLEVDGVLKSWAVPKGLPYRTGEKRLAMQVEDHPLEYGDFEGIIPEGEYGGGTVMLWDFGTYEVEDDAAAGIAQGKLHFELTGKKLKGEWALIRMAKGEKGNEWLIFKASENARPVSQKLDDRSAKSGQTMKQIAKAEAAVRILNAEESVLRDRLRAVVLCEAGGRRSVGGRMDLRTEVRRIPRAGHSERQSSGVLVAQ